MKTRILFAVKYSVLTLVITIAFYLPSCGWGDPCYRNFGTHTTNIVRVDRVELTSDTLFSNETQKVKLWDTIGTNSGYKFKGIEAIRHTNSIDLTVWNSYDVDCGATTTDTLLLMNGYAYNINPPLTLGNNSVIVHQPDGSTITRYYFVR